MKITGKGGVVPLERMDQGFSDQTKVADEMPIFLFQLLS